VRYVLGLTEPVVIGMADGHAQVTGRLAAANVHVQPGMANALSGILNAARARVPLLVTVGQQVRAMLPGEPFLGGDVVGMARPLAKGAWEATDAEDLGELLAHAIRLALRHPRGPTVLSLPMDVQAGPAPAPHRPVRVPDPPAPEADALDRAAAVLRGARAPLVLAGDGVAHAGAAEALVAVAERLGAPIRGEPFGALVTVPTDHGLWRGPIPGFASEIRAVLAPHDVVLAVAMPVFRLFGTSPGSPLPPGTALVHLEVDAHEVGKNHPPAAGVAGDPDAALRGLLERLGPAPPEAIARRAAAVAETARLRRETRARLAGAGGRPLSPAAFCRALADAVGPRDLVVDEALTAGRPLRAALGRRAPGTWLAHRGSALGWGLPAAVGAALADRGRRVLCVHGDGSAVFGLPALWTAAHERLGLAVVIADNGGYEILRAGMEGLTGHPEGPWPGLALRSPALDLVALARGFGASAERAEGPGDVREGLRDLWTRAREGPAVLVVPVAGRTPAVGYPVVA
jgi:benzoylformate decarboxylase